MLKLNNTQQFILEKWFNKQKEIILEKIAPENIRSWCIILFAMMTSIEKKEFQEKIINAYKDNPDRSRSAIQQLLLIIYKHAIGRTSSHNYLFKNLTDITPISMENTPLLKHAIGILFRANISYWMAKNYMKILIDIDYPANIKYLEMLGKFIEHGIEYYKFLGNIEKTEKLVKVRGNILESINSINFPENYSDPCNFSTFNAIEYANNIREIICDDSSGGEEYVEFIFVDKTTQKDWKLKILNPRNKTNIEREKRKENNN
jgi:hypothetical protein